MTIHLSNFCCQHVFSSWPKK